MSCRPGRVRMLFAAGGFAVAGWTAAAGQAAQPQQADPAAARLAPWKTVAAAGQVEAHPPAIIEVIWRAVGRGDLLSPQTTVRTGRRGRATLARGGSILIVDRDSRVDLPSVVAPGASSSVTQTQGRVVYKIEKADSKHFEVVTPYLVAGVKGTTFMVTVKDHAATVSVREGTVEVASAMTGEKLDVHAGESIVLGNEPAQRMELVSVRPSEDKVHDRKSDRAERARDDAARMASLLDASDAAVAAVAAGTNREPADELAGLAPTDAASDLTRMADDPERTSPGSNDNAIDPLVDPIDALPVDARSERSGGASAPVAPGPGGSGPGTSSPGPSGPGGSGPGSSLPGGPGSVDPTDTTLPRLPSRR